MARRNRDEGQEKRGVVQYGWTPPPDSPVKLGRHSQDVSEEAGNDRALLDALDDDITRRLAEGFREKLQ